MCDSHYRRELRSRKTAQGENCEVTDCPKPREARGLCLMHYRRLMTTGVVGSAQHLKARKGEGCVRPDGYRDVYRDGRRGLEHRMVMEDILGRSLQKHEYVHHKNGIRSDNRPDNLEIWVACPGQRPEDLINFLVTHYREELTRALS